LLIACSCDKVCPHAVMAKSNTAVMLMDEKNFILPPGKQ